MAYKTVANLRDSLASILTGLNVDSITNLNRTIERAARELATIISVPELMGKASITLYDGVDEYAPSNSAFGNSFLDIRRQGHDRNINDYVQKQGINLFDRTKNFNENGYKVSFEFVKGVARLRVSTGNTEPKVIIDSQEATTGWTAAGSASGLTLDETQYWSAPGSLRFTLTGSDTGTLTKTVTQQDISEYEDLGVGFLAIRTPSISSLTSIAVRLGSSDSAYDEVSVTQGFLGAWVVDEWLLVAFDFSGATSTGTPDWNAIDYLQVRIAHTGTITNFRVGGFWLSIPAPHTMFYQTADFFQVSGSDPSNTISANSDSVILKDNAYVIFEYLASEVIASQQGGSLAEGVITNIKEKLYGNKQKGILGLIELYRGLNPSGELRETGNWYDD